MTTFEDAFPYRPRSSICKRCDKWYTKKSKFNFICRDCHAKAMKRRTRKYRKTWKKTVDTLSKEVYS